MSARAHVMMKYDARWMIGEGQDQDRPASGLADEGREAIDAVGEGLDRQAAALAPRHDEDEDESGERHSDQDGVQLRRADHGHGLWVLAPVGGAPPSAS